MIQTTLRSDFAFWAASRYARNAMLESILATPARDFSAATPMERTRILSMLRHIEPVTRRARGMWADAAITTAPADFDFEHIRAPTLIIATQNDRFGTLAGARIAARRIPAARLITYPDGGHVWAGHDTELQAAVYEFLKPTAGDGSAQITHLSGQESTGAVHGAIAITPWVGSIIARRRCFT